MRIWVITFTGSSVKEFITANSRKDAISFYCFQKGVRYSSYCFQNGIRPSSYLKCRPATKYE